jgi:hypothetical protein
MDPAKIRLSKEEMELISNADWILTKNRLMEWTRERLAALQAPQWEALRGCGDAIPSELWQVPAKISRGDQYEGLPWLMLDLPRYFEGDDHFAIRSFFLWGHGFSLVLYIKGRFRKRWINNLRDNQEVLAAAGWRRTVQLDPWQHHFRVDNYQPIAEINSEEWSDWLQHHPFIKLGYIIPINQWHEMPGLLMEQYRLLCTILKEFREAD